MKFLLEFVACCGSPTSREKESPEPAGRLAEEETGALVRRQMYFRSNSNNVNSITNDNTRKNKKKKKRGRVAGSAAEEWKPTLGSICENNAVVMVEGEAEQGERVVKRKGSGGGGGRNSSSIDMASIAARYEESRRNYYCGTALPTFAPAPFLI